jgi:hypothetical protein
MEKHHQQQHKGGHYGRFSVELILEFVVMYLAMYSMIATLDHFRINLNNVYMTLIMLAPMAIIMLVAMRSMFPSTRMNLLFVGGALIAFFIGFVGMRTQGAVGDKELLRSMIPHHSGAILMCEKASLSDPEVIRLCKDIVEAQKREIAQMEGILARK